MAKGKVKLKIKKQSAQVEAKEEVLISGEQSVKLLAPSIMLWLLICVVIYAIGTWLVCVTAYNRSLSFLNENIGNQFVVFSLCVIAIASNIVVAKNLLKYIFNAFESIEKQNCDLMPDVRDLISLIIAHIVVCVAFYLYFKSALTIDIGAWLCGMCC